MQLGRGSINNISGVHEEETQFRGSQNSPESRNFLQNLSQSSQNVFNANVGGRNIQVPLLASAGEQKTPLINAFPGANMLRPLGSGPRVLYPEPPSTSVQASNGVWPPGSMYRPYPTPGIANPLHVQQVRNHFDLTNTSNTNVYQGLDKSFFVQQQMNKAEYKALTNKLPQFPHQTGIRMKLPNQVQSAVLHPQLLVRHDVQQNFALPAAISAPSHLGPPHLNHGYISRGYGPSLSNVVLNPNPNMHQAPQALNYPSMTMHLPRGALPPLPVGARPPRSQMIPMPQNPNLTLPNPPAAGAFSGLFSSLMAQGLISLTNQPSVQVGIC